MTDPACCTAFFGSRLVAAGPVSEVASTVREGLEREPAATVLILDDETARQVELDLRGTPAEVGARYREAPRAPGRPKLGVVAREVTLLPRHWEWLAGQPGGASVALRKLIDEARWTHSARDRVRRAQESAYRFMATMAGNEPGFEEATRALFARDPDRFAEHTQSWPGDVRAYATRLAADALAASVTTNIVNSAQS
jgi:uncharacterized protein